MGFPCTLGAQLPDDGVCWGHSCQMMVCVERISMLGCHGRATILRGCTSGPNREKTVKGGGVEHPNRSKESPETKGIPISLWLRSGIPSDFLSTASHFEGD